MSWKNMLWGTLVVGALAFVSCSIDDTPLSPTPERESAELVVQVHVQPTTALRTIGSWSNWTQAVDVAFVAVVGEVVIIDTSGGGHDHGVSSIIPESMPVGALSRTTSATTGNEILIGSLELPEMRINVSIAEAESMFAIAHNGDILEHAPGHDQHQLSVEVVETASGHAPHGNATVSHCNIEVLAISLFSDTFKIHLEPVQSAHGLRYEANTELPFDTYDLHVEVGPPSFLRDSEIVNRWAEHMETEFHDFDFDSLYVGGTIGINTWVGLGGDSLRVTLHGGAVKTYGAVGMGAIPLSGDETINFSVRLEDPKLPAHQEPLFGSVVTVSVTNTGTGETVVETLRPMYGHDGFRFAQNMRMGIDHLPGDTTGH